MMHSHPFQPIRILKRLLVLATVLIFSSCDRANKDSPPSKLRPGKPQVYVVNYPLKYFAQQIGGELIDVHFPAPRDVDPAFWKPSAAEIQAYQQADLILLNGADYEKWVENASLPLAKMVITTSAVKHQYIKLQETATHQHGPEGEHTHTGFAFTTWLDFTIAAEQAQSVHQALTKLLPDQVDQLLANFESLRTELRAIDVTLHRIVVDHHDKPLFASHPVYQYLERRYDLTVKSMHWEPDEFPSESQWELFDKTLTEHHARWMIWEAAPRQETIEALVQRGIETVVFNPCANEPPTGDFRSVMNQNLDHLNKAFTKQTVYDQ